MTVWHRERARASEREKEREGSDGESGRASDGKWARERASERECERETESSLARRRVAWPRATESPSSLRTGLCLSVSLSPHTRSYALLYTSLPPSLPLPVSLPLLPSVSFPLSFPMSPPLFPCFSPPLLPSRLPEADGLGFRSPSRALSLSPSLVLWPCGPLSPSRSPCEPNRRIPQGRRVSWRLCCEVCGRSPETR